MSYTPTEWNTGDTITASALNKIENGIANAGAVLVIQVDANNRLDKTVQEIYDAISSGTPAYIVWSYGGFTNNADGEASQFLMPVVTVYRYSTDTFRVVGMCTFGGYDIMCPRVVMFYASATSEYPTFLKNVTVNPSAVS